MKRTRAAIGYERELARIEAAMFAEAEAADAAGGEVHEGGRPEATDADAEDAAIFQA